MALSPSLFRKTRQPLAPAIRPITRPGGYDLHPAHPLPEGQVGVGHQALARAIEHDLRHGGWTTFTIDGYGGVMWDYFRVNLESALHALGIPAAWQPVEAALRPLAEIESLAAPFLDGEDPLFGTRFTGKLVDFYQLDDLKLIQPLQGAPVNIVFGCGAALAGWKGPLLYVDVPKNEIRFRSRAGSITNLGSPTQTDPQSMYKRFYFVDWIALNQHKADLLPRIDWFVDEQRPDEISVAPGQAVRQALRAMARSCFRVRPWFEPGPWGGQWLKENVPNLSPEEPNYAWSFELIAPENGLLLENDNRLLEISFDWLMYQENQAVLGDFARFLGDEFPIRFDYLDTFEGGNLPIQCNPELNYIRSEFGEKMMQTECYYIMDSKPGGRIHLGLKEGTLPGEFQQALEQSFTTGMPLDVERFVNSEPAFKHDLFLIPPGTIHGSGSDNLVLEISSTPYIYSFNLYDWQRLDPDGKSSPLSIERGLQNLRYELQGDLIRQELVAQPRLVQVGPGWRLLHLPTHRAQFYDIHRMEFSSSIEVETGGSCHVLNLVGGHTISLETADGSRRQFNYAETFVVPAAAGRYRLQNEGPGTAMVIKGFLKKGWFTPPDW